jgi:hypothetical protein
MRPPVFAFGAAGLNEATIPITSTLVILLRPASVFSWGNGTL